jgi:AcrR family transcriptional regulator
MDNDHLQIPLHDDSNGIRADARRNRALLLETAQQLFDEQGVEAVSMTAIADAASVGKGTLYRHFTSKAALCNALLDEDQRMLQADVLGYMHDNDDPLDKLLWFTERVFRFVRRNRSLLCAEAGSGELELHHQAHFWWWQTIAGLLEQLRPGEDVRYAAETLYVMLDVRTLNFQWDVMGHDDAFILAGLRQVVKQLAV